MVYLGVDVDQAQVLSATLRTGAELAVEAVGMIERAAGLADEPMPCALELDDVASDLTQTAHTIDSVIATVTGLVLVRHDLFRRGASPEPVRTPVAEPAPRALESPRHVATDLAPVQWHAAPGLAWDDVHQMASHNSFEVVGGIDTLARHGVRTFELDIHHQPPLHARADVGEPVNWHVYHVLGISHREYDLLEQGLAAVASIDHGEPLTLFIDSKDGFGGMHTPEALDRVVEQELGSRLFTPDDLLSLSPGATSLLDAVQGHGWPTVHELEGRVMVVLTDNIDGYQDGGRLAFVAPAPTFHTSAGVVTHLPADDAVFYNANAHDIGAAEVDAINASHTILRTYFNPLCPERFLGDEPVRINYRAVDIAGDGSICEPRVIVPPTPGPGPG